MQKVCTSCGESKPFSAFYGMPGNADGLMGKCAECHKYAMRKHRRDEPAVRSRDRERAKTPARREKARQDVIRWRREHPELYRAQNAINNAIRDGKLTRGACDCGATKNVFGIAPDPKEPLKVTWRCALCYHRSRFAVPPGTRRIVIDTFHDHQEAAP